MKRNERIVWGIEYCVKLDGKWSKTWTGPIGIYAASVRSKIDEEVVEMLRDRPFFFRIRKQAREEAETFRCEDIKARVRKYELSWEVWYVT